MLFELWRDERGQDLIEYSLLIMFIAIASMALLGGGKSAIEGIWETNKNNLQLAHEAIS